MVSLLAMQLKLNDLPIAVLHMLDGPQAPLTAPISQMHQQLCGIIQFEGQAAARHVHINPPLASQ